MKKILLFLFVFLFSIGLHSQEIGEGVLLYNEPITPSEMSDETVSNDRKERKRSRDSAKRNIYEDSEEEAEEDEENPRAKKKKKRIKNRSFEIGLVNLDVGLANNLLNLPDFFQEKVVLDLSSLKNGFNLSFDINIRPIFINLNFKNKWGIGLDIAKVSVLGNIDISGKLLNFEKTEDDGDPFGVGAAAFVDIGIPAFFGVGKGHWEDRVFKIKVRPAGFLTLAYSKPEMKYTFKEGPNGSLLEIDYGLKIFTPFSLEDAPNNIRSTLDLGSSFGFDISAGIEYQLFSWIDLGIDFINIPIFPSGLNYYMEMSDKISIDSNHINITDLADGKGLPDSAFFFPENFQTTYGKSDRITIFRPFKMLISAKYRPLKTPLLTLIPVVGFTINPYFVKIGMVEAGLTLMCDMRNFLITSFGIKYEDYMWKNNLDIVLNLHFFQFNLGVSMQSQSFVRSWTGAGVRLRLGLIFGW